MILIMVNRIRASKKLVLYAKFVETASRQISECLGKFEVLPESSMSCSLNFAYAGDYLDIPEVRDMGAHIKGYFRLSPTFFNMYNVQHLFDPELKKHCEAVKFQKATPKDLATYYIAYMERMNKEADPRVKEKLKKNQYADVLVNTPNPFATYADPQVNQFGLPPGGNNFGQPSNNFGQPPGNGFGQPPNNFGPPPGNFGQPPVNYYGPPPGNNFGGQGHFPQQTNPFEPLPHGGNNFGGVSYGQGPVQAPGPLPYQFHGSKLGGGNGMEIAKPIGEDRGNQYLTRSNLGGPPLQQISMHQGQGAYDDIFDQGKKEMAPFGGDKKPGNVSGGGEFDDLAKELDNLRNFKK